jgi:hypothetical protein
VCESRLGLSPMPSGFESDAIFVDPHELISDPYVED